MTFTLLRKISNSVKITYYVEKSAGDICGRINVAPEEETSLLQCWAGSTAAQPQASASAASAKDSTQAFVAELMKNRSPLSRAALLRSAV